jgi:flagellar hook-associated protein 2
VNITSKDDSLSGIANAISSAGIGVTATVVNGTDGSHLLINSGATGAANTVSIGVSNLSGDNGLSSLGVTSTPGVVSAGNPSGGSSLTSAGSIAWTQTVAAQDAQFTMGGTAATGASNTVTTVLSRVTLNLSAASVGTRQTLTTATDVTTQVGDIQTFVSDYNSLVSTMASQSSFDANGTPGQQGGPLLGDSMLTTIQSTLGNLVSSSVTSSGVTAELSSIGITLNDDGTLSVDTNTLTGVDPATQDTRTPLG